MNLCKQNNSLIRERLFYAKLYLYSEASIGFRRKLTQANKEKFEQAAKFNEEVSL